MAIVKLDQAQEQSQDQPRWRQRALEIRRYLQEDGLLDTPVDVNAVAERLGLEVSEEIMEKDLSGYLEFRNGRWVAGVNALHHRNRQRFSLAHEIGHYLLHRNQEFRDKLFTRRDQDWAPEEIAANEFAADLLMPEEQVRAAIAAGILKISELANTFSVSAEAMRFRVKGLGYKLG